MFDNSALDVAIGLFFIYALYSLIATTLSEIVSSLLQKRGKILREGIKRMLDNETDQELPEGKNKDDYLLADLGDLFLNKPEIKYLGPKGRYPSYIKAKTFAKVLLDIMEFDFENDKDLKRIKSRLNPKNETHNILIKLIDQANNNATQFKILAEEWYNEMMNRVAGWYKRNLQRITFFIGVVIAFGLNLNTIEISRKLGADDELRKAILQSAVAYSNNVVDESSALTDDQKLELLTARMDTLIEKSNTVSSIMDIKYPSCKDKEDGVGFWSYFLGCLLTAIALSLGAPFWFDLLNKLIKLRSSGTQEKTTNPNSQSSKPVG